MAKEILFESVPGVQHYVHVWAAAPNDLGGVAGQIYNADSVAFEDYATADIANYAIAATHQGTSSGYYLATFPIGAGANRGTYNVVARKGDPAAPAESDPVVAEGVIEWDGDQVRGAGDASLAALNGSVTELANLESLAVAYAAGVLNASVTEVTGSVGGNLAGSLSVAERAAIADKLLGRNLAGGSDGGRTVKDSLRAARNKVAFDVPGAGQFTVYAEDDTTPAWTGTYTRQAVNTLTGVDPA